MYTAHGHSHTYKGGCSDCISFFFCSSLTSFSSMWALYCLHTEFRCPSAALQVVGYDCFTPFHENSCSPHSHTEDLVLRIPPFPWSDRFITYTLIFSLSIAFLQLNSIVDSAKCWSNLGEENDIKKSQHT